MTTWYWIELSGKDILKHGDVFAGPETNPDDILAHGVCVYYGWVVMSYAGYSCDSCAKSAGRPWTPRFFRRSSTGKTYSEISPVKPQKLQPNAHFSSPLPLP